MKYLILVLALSFAGCCGISKCEKCFSNGVESMTITAEKNKKKARFLSEVEISKLKTRLNFYKQAANGLQSEKKHEVRMWIEAISEYKKLLNQNRN